MTTRGRRATHRSVPRTLHPHHPGSRPAHRRPRRHRQRHGDEPARRRPRAARGHSRRRQDEPGAHAGRRPAPEVLAHPVHARPDAGRHRRHQHRPGARARRDVLRVPAGPDLRQRRARRRDQPRHAEDAVGAARGDAGRQRVGRQDHLPARAAVPRARDAEPARDGGHVSAARSAARSLLLQAEGRRTRPKRRCTRSSSGRRSRRRSSGDARRRRPGDPGDAARRARRCRSRGRCRPTRSG